MPDPEEILDAKADSLARLAGRVAHDLNNVCQVLGEFLRGLAPGWACASRAPRPASSAARCAAWATRASPHFSQEKAKGRPGS